MLEERGVSDAEIRIDAAVGDAHDDSCCRSSSWRWH